MKDFKKLGFKCGLEIHQQIEGRKLFCNCQTIIRKDSPDFTIKRHLRASAGESGKFDAAAKFEQKKQKLFVYHGYDDTTCMVETDEEPPGNINLDAMNATLQICKMLNARIVDRIVFMRKVVVDGSNVSGFQRTALIGMDGYIETNGRKIGIPTICLEEEACQVIKRTDHEDSYNLSRMGIPLIEIATDPTIESPEECKLVAEKLGMILRSTGKCRRGIGSIRQDVNVSIKEGYRVEIKGFQDLKSIPKVVNYEIERQQKEKKKQGMHVRKAEPDFTTSYLRPMPGASRMYPETDVPHIIPDLKSIRVVKTLDERKEELKKKYRLNDDLAGVAVKYEDRNSFNLELLFRKYPNVDPIFIINCGTAMANTLNKKHDLNITINDFEKTIFPALNAKNISTSSVEEIIVKEAKGEKMNLANYRTLDEKNVEKIIKEIILKNKGAPFGALMGEAMKAFKGKVDGKTVSEFIKKLT